MRSRKTVVRITPVENLIVTNYAQSGIHITITRNVFIVTVVINLKKWKGIFFAISTSDVSPLPAFVSRVSRKRALSYGVPFSSADAKTKS